MADEVVQACLLVEVQWGVIPGTVEGQKQWAFTREQVEDDEVESWQALMAGAYAEFNSRMNPNVNNWVTMTWLWL